MMPPDVPEGGKGVVGSTKGGWHGIFGRSVMFHMGCMWGVKVVRLWKWGWIEIL